MTYMSWNSSMEVGHPTVDAGHKALVDHINAFVDTVFDDEGPGSCIKTRVAQALVRLRSAMVEFFRCEETLMGQREFPNLAEHRGQHQDLLAQFDLFVEHFTAGATDSVAHLARFLREWFDYHEENWDRPLGAWLRGGTWLDLGAPLANAPASDLAPCSRPAGMPHHTAARPRVELNAAYRLPPRP
jgi:hemerythrin